MSHRNPGHCPHPALQLVSGPFHVSKHMWKESSIAGMTPAQAAQLLCPVREGRTRDPGTSWQAVRVSVDTKCPGSQAQYHLLKCH